MATSKKTSAANKGLEDLFLDGLKDIYYAEKKILKALPKMAKGAEDEQVTAAFEKHRLETEGQVERLEKTFDMLGGRPGQKPAPPSMAFWKRERRSSTSTRGLSPSTRALSAPRRRLSIMRSRVTEPWLLGRSRWARVISSNSSTRPWKRRRLPTRPSRVLVKVA